MRARIDWKYALRLELTDSGFHFSVLTEFRSRLVANGAEALLLNTLLERFKARGLVRPRGKQRTDSTLVLGAVHDLHLLELVAKTLRATLDDLGAVMPEWLRRPRPTGCATPNGNPPTISHLRGDLERHGLRRHRGRRVPATHRRLARECLDAGALVPWIDSNRIFPTTRPLPS